MCNQSDKGMKKELPLLGEMLAINYDCIFIILVKILLKLWSFEINKENIFDFFSQRALFVQAPISNKTIRIPISVIDIVSFLRD